MSPLFQEVIVSSANAQFKKWAPNERYEYYLSVDTSWVCVDLLVRTPGACKVEYFSGNIQNTEKGALFLQAQKTYFWHTFFKMLSFNDGEIFPWNQPQMATNLLNILREKADFKNFIPYFKSGLNLSRNFDDFQEIVVQSNKAVRGSTF